MRRRLLLAAAAIGAVTALGGCARSVFPPGGPADTTPPRVIASAPADSAVRVPAGTHVELLFSEAMDRVSVRDGIRVYPPPGRPSYDWSGRRLRIGWDRPLASATTYLVLLSAGARDARGVRIGNPLTIRFSTGDEIDRGRISGILRARTLRRAGVPILAFADTLGPRPDTTGLEPSYATETDTAGVYALAGLPVGRGFTVHAFYDLNTNGSIEPGVDLVAGYPTPIRLTQEQTGVDSINIVAIDPRAPAVLSGTIATRDSTVRFRIEAVETTDSTLFRRVERVGPGAYALRVPQGVYRLKAVRLPPEESEEREVVVRREELIDAKAEEEYGPFEFVFGTIREEAPEPEAEPPPESEE